MTRTVPRCFQHAPKAAARHFQAASKSLPRRSRGVLHTSFLLLAFTLARSSSNNEAGGAKKQLNTELETLPRRCRCGCKTISSYFQVASKLIPRRLPHMHLDCIFRLARCTFKPQALQHANPKTETFPWSANVHIPKTDTT